MTAVGTVESLWRYPVKSMAGEQLDEAFVGFSGVFGDRCYAFKSSAARKGAPYLTATAQQRMLLYQPRFRRPGRALKPPNWEEAAAIAPGLTPADADAEDMALDVLTPSGELLAIDDPELLRLLVEGLGGQHRLTLVHSNRALTDCRPVSLISLQTVRRVGEESGVALDKRRFRANVYLDLAAGDGFAEDGLIGRRLRVGPGVVVAVLERDPRCKMISLDPETGEHQPEVLRSVARSHSACAGLYCATLVEGVVTRGDSVELLD